MKVVCMRVSILMFMRGLISRKVMMVLEENVEVNDSVKKVLMFE